MSTRNPFFHGAPHEKPVMMDAVQNFRRDGFVRLSGVLGAKEVRLARAAAREAMAKDGAEWDEGDRTLLRYVDDPWRKFDALREIALGHTLGSTAERLAGRPLRIWTDTVLMKPEGHPTPTDVHDDESTLPVVSDATLTAWIALVDVSVERGALGFIPGSHQRADAIPGEHHPGDCIGSEEVFARWPEMRWKERVYVPLRAGDCTFHDSRTLHMAGENSDEGERLSHAVVFVAADAVWDSRPHAGGSGTPHEPGAPLEDDRFPLAGSAMPR